jgi:hypothetical protein
LLANSKDPVYCEAALLNCKASSCGALVTVILCADPSFPPHFRLFVIEATSAMLNVFKLYQTSVQKIPSSIPLSPLDKSIPSQFQRGSPLIEILTPPSPAGPNLSAPISPPRFPISAIAPSASRPHSTELFSSVPTFNLSSHCCTNHSLRPSLRP